MPQTSNVKERTNRELTIPPQEGITFERVRRRREKSECQDLPKRAKAWVVCSKRRKKREGDPSARSIRVQQSGEKGEDTSAQCSVA